MSTMPIADTAQRVLAVSPSSSVEDTSISSNRSTRIQAKQAIRHPTSSHATRSTSVVAPTVELLREGRTAHLVLARSKDPAERQDAVAKLAEVANNPAVDWEPTPPASPTSYQKREDLSAIAKLKVVVKGITKDTTLDEHVRTFNAIDKIRNGTLHEEVRNDAVSLLATLRSKIPENAHDWCQKELSAKALMDLMMSFMPKSDSFPEDDHSATTAAEMTLTAMIEGDPSEKDAVDKVVDELDELKIDTTHSAVSPSASEEDIDAFIIDNNYVDLPVGCTVGYAISNMFNVFALYLAVVPLSHDHVLDVNEEYWTHPCDDDDDDDIETDVEDDSDPKSDSETGSDTSLSSFSTRSDRSSDSDWTPGPSDSDTSDSDASDSEDCDFGPSLRGGARLHELDDNNVFREIAPINPRRVMRLPTRTARTVSLMSVGEHNSQNRTIAVIAVIAMVVVWFAMVLVWFSNSTTNNTCSFAFWC